MTADLLQTLAGLVLLVVGGEALVRGASSLATRLGISTLVIGLTVVAFGTSAPELAVNLAAVSRGAYGLPFGNVIGSNLANTGLILAVASLIRPLDVGAVIIRREIPMMLLATLAATVLGLDAFLDDGENRYSGSDGYILLLIFGVFLYYTGRDMLAERAERNQEQRGALGLPRSHPGGEKIEVPLDSAPSQPESVDSADSLGLSVLLTLVGFVGLVIGGGLTVAGADGIARAFGISEAVIGLTLVAFGTSLPELVACVIACLRGKTDLAVGNVVGSNIFNLLTVLGITSTTGDLPVPESGPIDLMVLCGFSLLLWVLTISDRGRIIRAEGGLLLVFYVGYLLFRVGAYSTSA